MGNSKLLSGPFMPVTCNVKDIWGYMTSCLCLLFLLEVLLLNWSAALVQKEQRMKTGLVDRQTGLHCLRICLKLKTTTEIFFHPTTNSTWKPNHISDPSIQPDSPSACLNYFYCLCFATYSVRGIIFIYFFSSHVTLVLFFSLCGLF